MNTARPLLRLVIVGALPFALSACGKAEAPPEKPPRPVQVAAVEPVRAPHAARYSASIAPVTQVPVAFKSSGYVDALLQVRGADRRARDVQQGDLVTRGATLARVQQADYRARVQQADARVAQAQAAITKAKADLDRAEQLFAVKSLTQPDLDAARLAHDSSRAQLAAASSDVELAHSALQDTALTAPFAGVVLEKRIERGALAAPGSVAFVLGDVRSVKAVFGVPDTIVRTLKPGEPLTLTSDALPGRPFTGRVTSVSPAADPQTRTFSIEVTITNADTALKPGMIATVQLDAPTRGRAAGNAGERGEAEAGAEAAVNSVPLASIVKTDAGAAGTAGSSGAGSGSASGGAAAGSGYSVFVIDNTGGRTVARARAVTVGDVIGNAIEVSTGVRAGEQVITTGATLVKDGDPVRIIP
jgi:multidrug efflux system membrane fusion protein